MENPVPSKYRWPRRAEQGRGRVRIRSGMFAPCIGREGWNRGVGITADSQSRRAQRVARHGVPATSVRSYFDSVSDTFIGFLLQPWRELRRRKTVVAANFYLFDVGVANFLRGIRTLNRNSSEYGIAFEHFIAVELRSYLSYRRVRSDLTYWRTQGGWRWTSWSAHRRRSRSRHPTVCPTVTCEVCVPWPKRTDSTREFSSPSTSSTGAPTTEYGSCTGARSWPNSGATRSPGSRSRVELDMAYKRTYTYTYGDEDDIN